MIRKLFNLNDECLQIHVIDIYRPELTLLTNSGDVMNFVFIPDYQAWKLNGTNKVPQNL